MDINDVIGKKLVDLSEEVVGTTFPKSNCPYDICGGLGYTEKVVDGEIYTTHCKCWHDEILHRRFRKSNIDEHFFNTSIRLPDSSGELLKVINTIDKPIFNKAKNREVQESPEQYINRTFKSISYPDVSIFAKKFIQTSFTLLNKEPRKKSANLILFGEPDVGKTHLACAIAKHFLKNNKTVYFTSTLRLIEQVIKNKSSDIRDIISRVDLLIVDELGREYHSDSNWSYAQIHDFFRLRYNASLPTICTTNFYPNEISDFYDKALVSTFSSYFWFWLKSEKQHRVSDANLLIDQFGFEEETPENV